MRAWLLCPLAGCYVVSEMDAEEPCHQAVARYAQRLYACTADEPLSREKTRLLEEAHQCRIVGWAGSGFLDTGWSMVAMLETDGGTMALEHAWDCSGSLSVLECPEIVEADPSSGWLETVPSCAPIFVGPDGLPTQGSTNFYGTYGY